MKRIMIIGICGAGKSTFARNLNTLSKIELYHLDKYYWKPEWVETAADEWRSTVQELSDKPSWIIDGNYGGTMDIRLERADTIIYLDYPVWKCLWRITKRIISYHGKIRPDMPEGCKERFDLKFFHYVATFNIKRRSALIKKLNNLNPTKRLVIFKTDKDASRFLAHIKTHNGLSLHNNKLK